MFSYRLNNPFKAYTCPFCSKDYHLHECSIESLSYTSENLYKAISAQQNYWQKLFATFFVPSLYNKKFTRLNAHRKCPTCDRALPRNYDTNNNITVAIIGDTFSGKSHYIAATIHQLLSSNQASEMGEYTFYTDNSEVKNRYQTEYFQPLFTQKQILRATPTSTGNKFGANPLIYQLQVRKPRPCAINLLIYDISGEDLVDRAQFLSSDAINLLNAHAIIFLMDPWSMPMVAQRLADYHKPGQKFVSGRYSHGVLQRIIDLYREDAGITANARFQKPLALLFAKADLLPHMALSRPDYYGELYQDEFTHPRPPLDGVEVDQRIRYLLAKVEETPFIRFAQSFPRSRFFAVSATGIWADQVGTYAFIRPYRCLDPLRWILQELHIIE